MCARVVLESSSPGHTSVHSDSGSCARGQECVRVVLNSSSSPPSHDRRAPRAPGQAEAPTASGRRGGRCHPARALGTGARPRHGPPCLAPRARNRSSLACSRRPTPRVSDAPTSLPSNPSSALCAMRRSRRTIPHSARRVVLRFRSSRRGSIGDDRRRSIPWRERAPLRAPTAQPSSRRGCRGSHGRRM